MDNDPAALAGLAALLRGWGYDVAEASAEAGAVAAMQAAPAALWLFDYNLDDGDTGTALQARLGARFGTRPTLILSADDSLATRRDVLEQGLTLLHKPVRPLALKSIMDRLLAARAVARP
ncbi:MAG: response regulator [Stenotrophomonas sp.]